MLPQERLALLPIPTHSLITLISDSRFAGHPSFSSSGSSQADSGPVFAPRGWIITGLIGTSVPNLQINHTAVRMRRLTAGGEAADGPRVRTPALVRRRTESWESGGGEEGDASEMRDEGETEK